MASIEPSAACGGAISVHVRRYVGPRTLTPDNSVRSRSTSLVNLATGYQLQKHLRVALDVFTVFNAADSDIAYYFASRLPGEPLGGVDDRHIHPALPRTLRLNLSVDF
jgi:outer membrane receptor protein involved in Fe transport